MALRGNLRDFNITQLLNLINLARKTGALTVSDKGREARIYFQSGKLVHAFLNGRDVGLTGILERAGKISKEQARAIRSRAETGTDKELGLLLINAGYVAQHDILQSVRSHTLDVVYVIFTWTDGSFHFEPNELPADGAITVPVGLENIIMEGSRRVREHEMLQDALPDLDTALKFAARPDASLRDINLSAEEWRVISFINPRNTIEQIAQANSMNDFRIRKIVYGLLSAGLVELVTPQVAQRVRALPKGVGAPPPVKRSVILRLIDRVKRI
jgi:hypothetical protein